MNDGSVAAHEVAPDLDGRPRGKPPEKLLTIGQLVSELHGEFPDLSISKVRYLEDRGLLAPQRTKGKYRKYSRSDLRALRKVLLLQRDEYLPLDVIRERLSSSSTDDQTAFAVGDFTAHGMSVVPEVVTYSMDEICEAVAAEEEFILSLVEFKLLDRAADTGPAFTESDLEIARVCRRLARYNVEARNLRILSSGAEREAALIEQVATPALRSGHPDRKEHGVETVQQLGVLFAHLMQLLLRRELRRIV